jgi:tRNA pseudouridine38-40 synthase
LGLKRALNSYLRPAINILSAERVESSFHARYDSKGKVYLYLTTHDKHFAPLLWRYVTFVPWELDLKGVEAAVPHILGRHDFSSFTASGSKTRDSIREILRFDVITRERFTIFYIHGTGFLRHMVRNIVGTLFLVGKGELAPEAIKEILKGRDRSLAGPTAPPNGLYLFRVFY